MDDADAAPQAHEEPTTQECPQCHATIPVYDGYPAWCDRCGWNVQPFRPPPRSRLEALYARLGKAQSEALFSQVQRAGTAQPHPTVSWGLAFALATLVHGLTLAFAALGLCILVAGREHILTILVGLFFLLVAWELRPRLAPLPDDILPRDRYPALYAMADRIAAALHTRPVDGIVVDGRFGASVAAFGWRRRLVLFCGLPFFSVLGPQEKVFVIAHELAHSAAGDPARRFWPHTAIQTLLAWLDILRPRPAWKRGVYGLVAIILLLPIAGLAYAPWLALYAITRLLWRDSQRGEYLADRLAAAVSGSAAALLAFDKSHCTGVVAQEVRRIALEGGQEDLFAAIRRRLATMPPRELERIQRVEQLELSSLDVTHPPTAYRMALLRDHPVPEAQVTLSAADDQRLEQELAPLRGKMQKKALNVFLATVYR